jgi:hypothetical protein
MKLKIICKCDFTFAGKYDKIVTQIVCIKTYNWQARPVIDDIPGPEETELSQKAVRFEDTARESMPDLITFLMHG